MKVAFDISQTGSSKAGCGYLAYSLAEEIIKHPTCELSFLRTFGQSWWDPDNLSLTVSGADPGALYLAGFADQAQSKAFWSQPGQMLRKALGNPDIIHANNFYSPPPMPGTRQVYTLHDMTVFDCPQYTTEGNRAVCLQGTLLAACNADAIIANSEATKDNFLEYFSFDHDRITVMPLGSRFAQASGSERPSRMPPGVRFILAVGTIEPRKNYDTLLRAFKLVADRHDVTLVIAGKVGWNMESFDLAPAALGLTDRVRMLSYVSDAELVWLYENCVGFVYPSMWEGFGLPVLEALSRGCAVISSNATSLPEVAGDAALLFDPTDAEGLAGQMTLLLSDKAVRNRLKKRAVQQAARFSWKAAAELVRNVYDAVMTYPERDFADVEKGPGVERGETVEAH